MKKKTNIRLSLRKIRIARLTQSSNPGTRPVTDSVAICSTVCSHHEACTTSGPTAL